MQKENKISVLEIEKDFLVEKLMVKNMHFWPYLRNYIGSELHFDKDRQVNVNSSNILILLKSIFYQMFSIFKPAENVFMTSSCQRRLINDLYVDRMDYFIDNPGLKNSLLIEQPNPSHFPKKSIKTIDIVSKIPFYILEKIISLFIFSKIENVEVLQEIYSKFSIKTDYNKLSKQFIAQYKVFRFFYQWKKTKRVFLTVVSTNAARIKAAKDLGIKVVEFQHGIINKHHYSYHLIKNIDRNFYPDFLLTFGENEKLIFDDSNFFIKPEKVIPIGSFYLDYILNSKEMVNDKFLKIRSNHKKIVGFSCQDDFEDLWIPFIKKTAGKSKENAYILMLRNRNKSFYQKFDFPDNVYFIEELNTYQILKLVDIHCTINSTTAIESLSIGTPNVLLNINNLAKKYMQVLLKDNKFTVFVENPVELVEAIKTINKIDRNEIIKSNNSNIVNNYLSRISDTIKLIESA